MRFRISIILVVSLVCLNIFGQSTLTNFKKGSLIIPMDNSKQNLISTQVMFNVKAYGLVNALLQNNIPVYWVIKNEKVKDQVDFSVLSGRVFPSATVAGLIDYKAGPFIIDSVWTSLAIPIITSYGNSVAVYQAEESFTAPVRYQLLFKPKIAVFTNGNSQGIHTKALRLAGFSSPAHFDSISAQTTGAGSCYTFGCEPHWINGQNQVTNAVTSFLNSGGNFFSQCAAIGAYEQIEHYHTTNGIEYENSPTHQDNTNIYLGTDNPLMQFEGDLVNAPTGTIVNYKNNSGGYRPLTQFLVKKNPLPASGVNDGDVVMSNRKTGPAPIGGNVTYLGGHDYLKATSDLLEYARAGDVTWNNGLRIFYNAIFIPSTRPASCNFVFAGEAKVSSTVNNPAPCLDDTLEYHVSFTNSGPGTAHDIVVSTNVVQPGLTYLSYTAGQGSFSSGTNSWTIGDLGPNVTVQLVVRSLVSTDGTYTLKSYNSNLIAGNDFIEDTTSLVFTTNQSSPLVMAPAAINTNTNNGCTATGVNLGTPVVSDACGIASVTHNAPSAFPLGITTVTWTVTDNSGNTANATQTVTVTDSQNPVIAAPANVSAFTNAGCTAAGVNLGTPVTSDNCTVSSVTNNAPSAFPLGITTVTWTATDNSGNTASATQTVTVTDSQNPVIAAPANVSAFTNSGCTAAGVNLGTPVTSDNCTVNSVTNNAPSAFPLGTTTVTWTATDNSGNTASAIQTVTVTDSQNPVIAAPANVSAFTNSGCTAAGVNLGTPVTSDNCTVSSVTNNAPSAFPLGTTTVTWTATDNSGNTASTTQLVTVSDNVNPGIIAPANITVYPVLACDTTLNIGTPITTDNCGVASVTNNAPAVFPAGATTVTWTVTDNSGHTETANQTILVLDTVYPTITIPASMVVYPVLACDTVLNLTVPETSDNCGIASVINNAPPNFPLGATTVVWTVTDNSGNTTTVTQLITISDTLAPQLTAPGNVAVSATTGCTATGVNLGDPVTFDNCEIVSVLNDAPAAFPLGITTVTWTATDNSGNTATASQMVAISDTEAPVFSDCGDTIKSCEALVTFPFPSATDNCTLLNILQTDVTGLNSGSIFPEGFTTLQYQATDQAGNQAVCTKVIYKILFPGPPNAGEDQRIYSDEINMDAVPDAVGTGKWSVVAGSAAIADETNPKTLVSGLQKGNTSLAWTISNEGCVSGTDTVGITVLELDIPNAFSPDGDNRNDFFEIRGIESYGPARLVITNRWGEAIYESNDYHNEWDARNKNGQDLTNDTYYYQLVLNDESEFSGFIIVKRK